MDEPRSIEVSISKEFYEHYEKVKGFRDRAIGDTSLEPSQQTAALNATTSILRDMVKIEKDIYNSQKFAILQQVVVDCLKKVSPELQEEVIEEFETRLEHM